jgi:hypothetical protein
MEHRNFVGEHVHVVAPFGRIVEIDSENVGSPYTNRSTVCMPELRCNLNVPRNLHSRNGLHGYHNIALQSPRWSTRKICSIHGDILSLLSGTKRNASFLKGAIVRETTSNQKCDRVFRPDISHVVSFLVQLSASIYCVSSTIVRFAIIPS